MKLSSRKTQRNPRASLQMTSMIDVVFLLLIFFMTTASFVRTERNLATAIKVNDKSSSSSPNDLEPAIVEVVSSGGVFLYRIGGRETESLEELTGILKQFDNKLDGAFVRVSDGAPFGMAASAIQACKSAQFTTVSYVPMAPGK
jgi:biopolymer transport protein ExbD